MGWNSAFNQNLLIGFLCFCCPGMFNALNSLDGGINTAEQKRIYAAATSVLSAVFIASSFVAPAIFNVIGGRLTLLLGASGYPLFVLASKNLAAHPHGDASSDLIMYAGGAILGTSAGLLWSAQGALCMAYPTKDDKGKYFSYFWVIFNLGAVIGSAMALGLVVGTDSASASVPDVVYWSLIFVMIAGALVPLTLSKPEDVIRSDGTQVEIETYPNWIVEAKEMFKLMITKEVLLLSGLFFYSNFFYTYQFQVFPALFSVRTKTFLNILYWSAQMLGAYLIGRFLDCKGMSIRNRSTLSLVGFASIIGITWTIAPMLQQNVVDNKQCMDIFGGQMIPNATAAGGERYVPFFQGEVGSCAQLPGGVSTVTRNFYGFEFGEVMGPAVVYTLWGACDAFLQVWAYWLMGHMKVDTAILVRYAGCYKTLQNVGATLAGSMNAAKGTIFILPWTQIAVNAGILTLSVLPAMMVANNLPDSDEEAPDGVKQSDVEHGRVSAFSSHSVQNPSVYSMVRPSGSMEMPDDDLAKKLMGT